MKNQAPVPITKRQRGKGGAVPRGALKLASVFNRGSTFFHSQQTQQTISFSSVAWNAPTLRRVLRRFPEVLLAMLALVVSLPRWYHFETVVSRSKASPRSTQPGALTVFVLSARISWNDIVAVWN